MKKLYLAWQDASSRRWFPVGRLVQHPSGGEEFEFAYIRGAEEAERLAGFRAMPEFPRFDRRYQAAELFPTFRNRVMNASRADRAAYLQQLGLDAGQCDELTELSVSGGQSHSDRFEIFPGIEPDAAGRFHARLTLHGLRHVNPHAVDAVRKLKVDDVLGAAYELDNPATGYGILVHTRDYYTLGWLPRYIAEAIHRCSDWATLDAKVNVARVNHHAPLSHRLLVNFSGRLRADVNPMRDLPQYQPIPETEGNVTEPAVG